MPRLRPATILVASLVASLAMSLAAAAVVGNPLPEPIQARQETPQERIDARDVLDLELARIEAAAIQMARRTRSAEVRRLSDEVRHSVERVRDVLRRRPGTEPPPVDPGTRPPPVDPGTRPPPVDPPPANGEPWPDGLPFDAPQIPAYAVPTLEDCEWIAAGGMLTSTRGLPSQGNVHDAYRASIAAGHALPVTFGVRDALPLTAVGGLWNPEGPQSITQPDGAGGWAPVSVEFLGLDDECEVLLTWTDDFGRAEYVGAFNVGLRGNADSFIIRANDGVGRLILDGCWWLPHKRADGSLQYHTSAMHVDKWETLVWRNHRFRGEKPTDPGTLVDEHSGYLKSCVGDPANGGGTWIVGNDLRGGNRTGFQLRPEKATNPRPRGPIVIAYNHADGYGFTHQGNNGGGCLTSWVGPESPLYVFGNVITDARYSCLVVSGQGSVENWLNADGFPIESVHLWGNTFENARGDRACVTVSAVESVHLWGGDTYNGGAYGDLIFDNPVNMQYNGIANGSVAFHGQDVLDYVLGLDVRTFDPASPGKTRQMPADQLRGYLVTEDR